MRLAEFNIKNFRSIVDSGWNSLSSDNITALIGQNESGKTSVLEALYSFYDGAISEDILRSDMSLPEVSCTYIPESVDNFDYIDSRRMPPGVLEEINKSNRLVLTRRWSPDLSSRICLSGNNIPEIFDKLKFDEIKLIKNTINRIENLIGECLEIQNGSKGLEESILSLKKRLAVTDKKHNDLKKQLKRTSNAEEKDILKRNIENVNKEYQHISETIKEEETRIYENKIKLSDKDLVKQYGEDCLELFENMDLTKSELEGAYKSLREIEGNMYLLKGEKEIKAGEAKLFQAKQEYIMKSRQMETLTENAGIKIRLVKNLLDNIELSEAEKTARQEYETTKKLYSQEEAGELFFRDIPRHEFFEDFSSLLPNRIDLEDIFENNSRVEGFKAVRNFLIIAGLDPEFFRQTNNRILKQKIENLNNEVTVDFQEYWRQNVGKTNKIRINFELEHYDISHPEKKGRPYLEFWVKDQHERLYPKQRSRGVRWFLSFYLELKAFARENKNLHRVLLIDEPALSLHARAQEDVLKVFEDIKGKIQIIYTTHSPHLIDHSKLYRLLAVQRAYENSEQSETIIFDASHLHSATSDTLSPVCSLMGTGLTQQESQRQSKNVIVEDITSFYFLSAIYKLFNDSEQICFLPANGPAGVPTLVNLLMGWGYEFSVLLFNNKENNGIINELQSSLHDFEIDNPDSRLQFAEHIPGPEDLFSTLDFKKFIIKTRVGISGSNSGYIIQNEISRPLLAASFAQSVSAGDITISCFDDETQKNMEWFFDSVVKKIRTLDETL